MLLRLFCIGSGPSPLRILVAGLDGSGKSSTVDRLVNQHSSNSYRKVQNERISSTHVREYHVSSLFNPCSLTVLDASDLPNFNTTIHQNFDGLIYLINTGDSTEKVASSMHHLKQFLQCLETHALPVLIMHSCDWTILPLISEPDIFDIVGVTDNSWWIRTREVKIVERNDYTLAPAFKWLIKRSRRYHDYKARLGRPVRR
ncbi:hypothetical protein RCL1_006070 [Eukaryota sp. TZLM3-RCL]